MHIEAKELTKIYGGGENRVTALDRASLTIAPGDFISIMGPSGSGKSTLLLLMLGAYQLGEGTLYLSAKDGRRIPLGAQTRRLFAYVPQNNHLFSGTLRENITFLCDDVSEEEIAQALRLSCVEQFLDTLPDRKSVV